MEKSYFNMVGECHKKFGFPVAGEDNGPHLVDDEIRCFRRAFLREEYNEFCRAQDDGNLVEIADALVDIVVVALGTAHFYGLPFDKLFAEVQRSNMEKERGVGKRGVATDLVKPEGWKKPDILPILEDAIRQK